VSTSIITQQKLTITRKSANKQTERHKPIDKQKNFAMIEYKMSGKNAKRVISSAKEKKQKECENDLNDSECQNKIFRMA